MSKRLDLLFITLLYSLLTMVMTWPLAAGLTRDVPGDLGDSLLNMWILGWGAEHFPRVAWNANIFHPEPLALAFSEHLFGQVLQILPVYYLTDNLILCYNLLFLSSFVLSGVGMYLLVYDITENRYAAFLAGLIYAFVPFRVAQIAHIQTISSQWMPFALYGFRRYIGIGAAEAAPSRWPYLVLGTAALLMQNWSCGYYLIYFAPFVVLFVVHQIAAAGRFRDVKLWTSFAAAAAVVAAGTWPFLALYIEAQRVHAMGRPMAEIVAFSADVYGYLTAPEALRLWGSVLRAWPRPEGELFLGIVPMLLALFAFKQPWSAFFRVVREPSARFSWRRAATWLLASIALVLLAGFVGILFTGGFVTSIAGIPIRATNPTRLLAELVLVVWMLLQVSRDARRKAMQLLVSPAGLAVICFLLAVWLSLGPVPHTRGQTIPRLGLYGFFLDQVPGVAGLRVPARYAMIAALYLSILAGMGAAWMMQRVGRHALVATVLAVAFLIEAAFAPMPVNQTWGDAEGIVPPARVEPAASAPAVYRQLASMPDGTVVAEFPFGDPAWELRYVYYSTVHWKPILNGYSGGFPRGYSVRAARLQRVDQSPAEAWQALIGAGTTHAIVHEAALTPLQARIIESWLEGRGARAIGRFDTDVLYDLSP